MRWGFLAGGIFAQQVKYWQHQRSMANAAGRLMRYVTLIREGETERAVNALDGEINWRLKGIGLA